MLAIMYGNQSDFLRLEEVIEVICAEECWALPAHADRSEREWQIVIDLFENTKLKKMALFQQRCFLTGGVAINFSDSQKEERYRTGLTAYLSKRYAGAEYKASRFVSYDDGKMEIDIETAYGLGKEDKVTRKFLFERDSGTCIVIDSFILSGHREVTENLVTLYKPMIKGCEFVFETQKNKFQIKVKWKRRLS